MSFCASCGRPRDETGRFCGGCGAAYGDGSGAPDTAQEPASPAEPTAPQPGATRTDLTAAATRVDAPGDRPDPFASWYQPKPPDAAPSGRGDNRWQPTQTVQAAPAQQAGYRPAGPPPVAPAPPVAPGPPPGGPRRDGRRGLFITLAIAVVLAAGGGAYALASSLGRPASTTAATQPSPAPPSTAGRGSPASASPSPPAAPSLVAVASGVTASAAEAQVETLLSRYFDGINTRDYPQYASTLNPARLAQQPRSVFDAGYATTTDSGMTLTSLAAGASGLTATVTFTSHQSAATSVDKSTCNDWTLNFYLVPQGTGYLIGPAPAGYQPDYADC